MNQFDQEAADAFDKLHPTWEKKFPVIGKGTFLFDVAGKDHFFVRVEANKDSWIGLTVTKDRVSFIQKMKGEMPKTLTGVSSDRSIPKLSNVGIEENHWCTYWLSYDRDNMVIKYGKGYAMKITTIMTHRFKSDDASLNKKYRNTFFDPKVERKVGVYQYTEEKKLDNKVEDMEKINKEVDFLQLPVVSDLSPFVMDSSKVNMFDLDSGKYMYSASLPPSCQTLYNNIMSEDVHLDFEQHLDKYEFSLIEAIRYSLNTKGCALYEKVMHKGEFDQSLNERYLRVTLGAERTNGPGIPYVVEIWPSKCGSPIHNHGNSYAVIRVLHGGLTIAYYNKMSRSVSSTESSPVPEKLDSFRVKKGDVTWIAPNWYQTHKLWNYTEDFCITIQCYMYGRSDDEAWPYFDYLDSSDHHYEVFDPDSDYSFTELYNIVMEEYAKVYDKEHHHKDDD